MASSLILGDLTIDNTLGAILVGFAVACCAYGILLSQVFDYFMRYPSDKAAYKFLVVLLVVLETADQCFIGHLMYFYGISNFADVATLLKANVTWSFIMTETVGAVVGTIVKTSFSMRVWRFSERNIFITGVLLLLSLGELGLAITFAVKAFQLSSVFDVVQLRVLGTTSLGVGVLTDILIAASLCYFLNKLRTGYHQSDSLVNSLVRYAISTGVFTGAVSAACLTLYNTMPHALIFIAVYFTLSKLYAISFMATLNTRRVVRGKGTDKQGTTSNNTNMFHLGTRMPTVGAVEVTENWNSYSSVSKDMSGTETFPLNEFTSQSASYPSSGRIAYAV